MKRIVSRAILLSSAWALAACGPAAEENPQVRPVAPPPPTVSAPPPPPPQPPPDPLGDKPEPGEPPLFTPPVPAVHKHASGVNVWLVERHELPIVAVTLVVPYGASSDPKGKEGLAYIAAGMLDEGAGKRGAIEVSRAIDLLGASLRTGAYADYSYVSLITLKKNLEPAIAIWGDVVARPRFLPEEWRRVHELWTNDLRARSKDPNAVAAQAELKVVFGAGHPYGHPNEGLPAPANGITLDEARAFYTRHFRPDVASVVVVGDATAADVDRLLDKVLAGWRPPKEPPPAQPALPAPTASLGKKVILVDRADAPQSVISYVRPGVAANAVEGAALSRVNAALGGSFTSRLNQDLREDKGWTYGAKSRFSFARGQGLFSAGAAVFTDKTGEALKLLVSDVDAYVKGGPTDDEVKKTRLLARGDLVETFEAVEAAAQRLARNAGVGLPPDFEATSAKTRDSASKSDLAGLAGKYVGGDFALVVVGPRAAVEPQLRAAGFNDITVEKPEPAPPPKPPAAPPAGPKPKPK
jgi:predicted Zn-dependent peptidase